MRTIKLSVTLIFLGAAVAAAYDLGVNSYIRKQVDFTQFDAAIKQWGDYWLVLNEPPPKVRLG